MYLSSVHIHIWWCTKLYIKVINYSSQNKTKLTRWQKIENSKLTTTYKPQNNTESQNKPVFRLHYPQWIVKHGLVSQEMSPQ